MAENNLNTRIQLLYDTYTNWSTKNPKLKKGEMVQVEVPAAVGDVTQVPSILIKTGDGEHNFNDLPWTSGLAADVYDWAKAKEAPRSAWYVNITGTPNEPTGDKTPAEIYQAYTNGYAVYAVVQMADLFNETPFILPLVSIIPVSDSYKVAFSASAEPHKSGDEVVSITVTWNQKWYLFASELAKAQDALPAMSSDTKGKMLTNDGDKAEWGDVPKEVMCVNFTQGTDGNWSADKKWDEAAALIEAGGYVYAMFDGISFPLVDYSDNDFISFMILKTSPLDIRNNAFRWNQDGTIKAVLDAALPVVLYVEQELTADQQAQACKNIGLTPVAKTDAMTQSVGLDAETGELYTTPAEVFCVDLEGNYPDYTCPVAMADIKTAYEAGKVLECRCTITSSGTVYTATLPLFIPMPSANTWVFSGAGALRAIGFPAQSLTVAIVNGTVQASNTRLAKASDIPSIPDTLPNPNALTIKVGDTTTTYDGSAAETVEVPTKTSELTNDSNFITSSYVDTKVASLVDSAPETLDTLKELSAALGDDPNFATTISNQIGNKADKAQVLNITLAPASWTTSGNEFKYTYSNTSLRALVSPIITCTSNTSEYKYITDAEATANTGIIFTAKTKPTNNIILQIIDLG